MLIVENQEYFDKVMEFAKSVGKEKQLSEKLDYLRNFACPPDGSDPDITKTHIYKDFAPYSFQFAITRRKASGEYDCWFNGGLIFHGNHDGGGDGGFPTLSVNLNPVDGWEIHT